MEPFSEFALAFLHYWVVAVMTLRNAAADFKKYTYMYFILDFGRFRTDDRKINFFLERFQFEFFSYSYRGQPDDVPED